MSFLEFQAPLTVRSIAGSRWRYSQSRLRSVLEEPEGIADKAVFVVLTFVGPPPSS